MTLLRRLYWMLRIRGLRIVDREYFAALSGRVFRTDLAAIWFYLVHERDRELGLSLSPLIEADWMAKANDANDASWYAALLREKRLISTSPLFDGTRYVAGLTGGKHPSSAAGALRQFLGSATAETLMPSHPARRGDSIQWGEFRRQAISHAARFATQLRLRRPRVADTWDAAREREFLVAIDRVPLSSLEHCTVTVVMAARGTAPDIDAAIESVRSQSFAGWRLIVVDDGLVPSAAHVATTAAHRDSRVEYFRSSGSGVSAARNQGLAEATGEVIAFLDADNSWRPEFLERSLKGRIASGSDFVYCGMRLTLDDGVTKYRGMDGSRDDLLQAGNFLDLNSVLLSRSLVDSVGGFDDEVARWVDYDLFLALSLSAPPTYLPFLGVDYDARASSDRISTSEPDSWEDAVLGKHLLDWPGLAKASDTRTKGLTSILMPTYGDWSMTATAVAAVLDSSGTEPVEVIVIDNGSQRQVSALLVDLFGSVPNVSIERMARNLNFALGTNVALSRSAGDIVVALNNDTEVGKGWLSALLDPVVRDPRVLASQPLLTYPDGTVQSAGTVFIDDTLPRHFLASKPVELALAAPATDYSAITAAALCIRADDLIALHGFDPIYRNGLEDVDLCLRGLIAQPGKRYRVVLDSRVVHHEGQSANRSRSAEDNRRLFWRRWRQNYPPSDGWRYDAIGIRVGSD